MLCDGSLQLHQKTCPNSLDAHFVGVALAPVVAAAALASNFADLSADLLVASARAPVTNQNETI